MIEKDREKKTVTATVTVTVTVTLTVILQFQSLLLSVTVSVTVTVTVKVTVSHLHLPHGAAVSRAPDALQLRACGGISTAQHMSHTNIDVAVHRRHAPGADCTNGDP